MTLYSPPVKVKKLYEEAELPQKKSEGAAAYDLSLYSPNFAIVMAPGSVRVVNTGIAIEVPPCFKGEVYSRSGLSSEGVCVMNSPGKIDSDYRGEVKVILFNSSKYEERTFVHGERIAQIEISPVYETEWIEVDELSKTIRGEGGIGSTGRASADDALSEEAGTQLKLPF